MTNSRTANRTQLHTQSGKQCNRHKRSLIWKGLVQICFTVALLTVSRFDVFAVDAQKADWTINTSRLGLLKPASALIGKKVEQQNWKSLGTLQDFLCDIETGQVVIALLATGDNSQLTPVPVSLYLYSTPKVIYFPVERKLLAQAPRVSRDRPLSALEPDQRKKTFRHFDHPEPVLTVIAPGEFASTSRLLGVPVFGRNGEPLGSIKDLMMDLPQGRLVYAVIEPQAGSAAPGELYPVPPVVLRPDPVAHVLRVDLHRSQFLAGPRFSNQFWTDMASPNLAIEICRQFGLPAPLPAQASSQLATSRPDQEINQAITAQLVQLTRNSAPVSIVVSSVKGHVTLTGTVLDDDQKRQVLAAAERVAGAGNVEDRIETRHKRQAAGFSPL